jgi:hypothetical protein
MGILQSVQYQENQVAIGKYRENYQAEDGPDCYPGGWLSLERFPDQPQQASDQRQQ